MTSKVFDVRSAERPLFRPTFRHRRRAAGGRASGQRHGDRVAVVVAKNPSRFRAPGAEQQHSEQPQEGLPRERRRLFHLCSELVCSHALA